MSNIANDFDFLPNASELKAKLEQMQQSPEYQADRQWLQQECQRLDAVAQRFGGQLSEIAQAYEREVVRVEYATWGTIPRGFYCPSPVFDLVVGNTKRGKLCSRKPSRAKSWYEYGFDKENRLLWCHEFFNGKPSYSEYLIYEENHVYGIKADSERVSTVYDEIYENGRLTRLLHGMFLVDNRCRELNVETYEYDDSGITAYTWHNIMIPLNEIPAALAAIIPQTPFMRRNRYTFQKENGLACSYSDGKYDYKITKARII